MSVWRADEAVRLLAAGQFAAAEELCARRCADAPDDPEAWFLLGATRDRLGRTAEALEALQRSSTLDPTDPRPRGAAGALLADGGWPEQGLAWFQSALALRPADPRLLTNAALALEALGRDAEALDHYDRALAAFPGMGDARLNRTALKLRLGRYAEALEDAAWLVERFPDHPAAWFNHAEAALALGRTEEALNDCERALARDAKFVKAWIEKSVALAILGRLDESQAALASARSLDARQVAAFRNVFAGSQRADGELLDPRRIYLDAAWERQRICDWRDRAEYLRRFAELVAESAGTECALRDRALMFALLALPLVPATRSRLAADIATEIVRNARSESPRFTVRRAERQRLRIGYLSPNFRTHPSAFLTRRLYRLHDRSRFEIHGYSLRADEGPLRREIESTCDVFRDLAGLGDAAIARRIHEDGVDLLVDLCGYFEGARPEVMAMEPAPVRVSYLGYAGSLGPGLADYRITDALATPISLEGEFVEALARLPHTHYLCDDESTVATGPSRGSAGLPDAGFVFCCFNNHYKIEPGFFAIWMRLLQAVPGAVLWLLEGTADTRANLCAAASAQGVDPARLRFAPRVPRGEHLARLALANLFLDTRDYNAHATACDAVLAGLPVLTCAGQTMASRLGASIVTAAGTPELAVTSEEAYERLALGLARDPQRVVTLRQRLERRDGVLFETAARVRAIEQAYLQMWARHLAGRPPASFEVSA